MLCGAISFTECLSRQPSSTLFPYTTLFRSPTGVVGPPRQTRKSLTSPTTTRRRPSPMSCAISSSTSSLAKVAASSRSEEHTSELQSPYDLVCRLLLEKKKNKPGPQNNAHKN